MPSKIVDGLKYTKNHEWVRVEGEYAYTGISDHAQEELTDVVYVELPNIGDSFDQGEPYAVVESVKAASDCYLPVSGEIVEVNEDLEDSPELVNDDPYGDGWFAKILISDEEELSELMDAGQYDAFLKAEGQEGGH